MRTELDRIKAEYPGLEFKEAYDNSYLVNIILDSTFQELLISVLLAGIVILVFFRRLPGHGDHYDLDSDLPGSLDPAVHSD